MHCALWGLRDNEFKIIQGDDQLQTNQDRWSDGIFSLCIIAPDTLIPFDLTLICTKALFDAQSQFYFNEINELNPYIFKSALCVFILHVFLIFPPQMMLGLIVILTLYITCL